MIFLEYSMAPMTKKITRLDSSLSLNFSLLVPPLFIKAQIMGSLGPCVKSSCGWHSPEKSYIRNVRHVVLNYIYNTFLNAPRWWAYLIFKIFFKAKISFVWDYYLSINTGENVDFSQFQLGEGL